MDETIPGRTLPGSEAGGHERLWSLQNTKHTSAVRDGVLYLQCFNYETAYLAYGKKRFYRTESLSVLMQILLKGKVSLKVLNRSL